MNREAWTEAPTREEVRDAVGFILTTTSVGLPDKQRPTKSEKAAIFQLVAESGYSRMELRMACREVPRDPDRFQGRCATPADIHRVIMRDRKLRKLLTQQVSTQQRFELLEAYPELDPERFRQSGFTLENLPGYRYITNHEDDQ